MPDFLSLTVTSFTFLILLLLLLYLLVLILTICSSRVQSYFIYLHPIQPPSPPSLFTHSLAAFSRSLEVRHLKVWHISRPGPPWDDLSKRLAEPNQLVFVIFHGNCGTRAFPAKRIASAKLLNACFDAHIITFDYSGFGDTPGSPRAGAILDDALTIYEWLQFQVHRSTRIYLFGQSLGSFPAVHLSTLQHAHPPHGLILDSPPLSLVDAAMTHPTAFFFRLIPFVRSLFNRCLHDANFLDNGKRIAKVRCEILIVHGEQDWMIPAEQAICLQKLTKGRAQLKVFRHRGHNDVISDDMFLPTIWQFLKHCDNDMLLGVD